MNPHEPPHIVLRLGSPALTTSMRMRYLGVVAVGRRYRCVARATAADKLITARAEVLDEHGAVMATATAGYRPQAHPTDTSPGA